MRSARYLFLCSVLLLVSGQAPMPTGGTVTGEVEMDKHGKLLPEPADVWVYLEDVERPRARPGTGWTAPIVQKNNRTFDPRVLLIPVGATVTFPNKDTEEHNVFSPAKGDNEMWDLGRYGPKKTNSKKFLVADEYAIYCDLHKEMSATIKVVPTRHFVRVTDGRFTLTNVPPGRYKVVAWAPGSAEVKSDVLEVVAGVTRAVPNLNLHWGALNTIHLRMDGTQYPYP